MSYTNTYQRINWQNLPSEATALNDVNLNKMDAEIYAHGEQFETVDTALGHKVDKESGKGLSTIKTLSISTSANTGTNIASISYKDQNNLTVGYTIKNGVVVDSALSSSSENPVQNKVVKSAIDAKSTVSISDTLVTGDTIANLTINGTTTAIKAPLVEVDDELSTSSTNPVQNKIITEALREIMPEETVTGNPISITDGSNVVPAKQAEVTLLPIQDLHGYDSPWVGGAGKNKLQNTATTTTVNGVTFTVNSDGSVTANGTATADINYTVGTYTLKAGTAIKYNGSTGGTSSTYWVTYSGYPKAPDGDGTADRTSATSDWTNAPISIGVANGTTLSNKVFKPMIRLASVSDGTFEPYENICPISGRVSVELERTGKNSAKNDNATNPNRNDYTYSVETDDKVIGKKTIVGGSFFVKYSMFVKEGVTYTFSFGKYTIDGTEQNSANIYVYSDELWGNSLKPNWNVSKSGSSWKSTYTGKVVLGIFNGSSVNTILEIDDLQVEIGSTATTYEAYQGETYTETLGQTVYGGKVDFVNGKLTIDKTFYTFNGTETWYVNASGTHSFVPLNMKSGANMDGISSIFPTGTNRGCVRFGTGNPSNPNNRLYLIEATQAYGADTSAKLNTLTNGSTICYPLATPIEIRLTAEQISLLKGNNVLVSDSNGNIKLTYSADIKAFIENQLSNS